MCIFAWLKKREVQKSQSAAASVRWRHRELMLETSIVIYRVQMMPGVVDWQLIMNDLFPSASLS